VVPEEKRGGGILWGRDKQMWKKAPRKMLLLAGGSALPRETGVKVRRGKEGLLHWKAYG